MTGSVVRRVVVPVVVAATVVVALPRQSPPRTPAPPSSPAPSAGAPLTEDPLAAAVDGERAQALLELWEAWGPDLVPTDGPGARDVPDDVRGLPFAETVYVLASVRVAQLAAAQRRHPSQSLAAAATRSGLGPEPPAVTAAAAAGGRCVALEVTYEAYGRTFYGLVEEGAAAAAPTSVLEDALLRRVRVGVGGSEDPTCGSGAAAFSPGAQQALESLSPELLEH